MEMEGKDPLSTPPDLRQGGGSLKTTESMVPSTISVPGVQVQRPSGHRVIQKWKGPDKISKIYGDWIDDIE